jgi:hypothetical protein
VTENRYEVAVDVTVEVGDQAEKGCNGAAPENRASVGLPHLTGFEDVTSQAKWGQT